MSCNTGKKEAKNEPAIYLFFAEKIRNFALVKSVNVID